MNPDSTNMTAQNALPTRFGNAKATEGAANTFLEYYGLAEQPFGVTPDPRFLYLGSKHREALAALDYGTMAHRGFLALIAKPGMGKTSLLFHYLESLRDKARTAFVFQTDGDSRDLMRYLLADVGLDAVGKDLPEMRSMLNDVLLREMRAGRQLVLVIDEAQNLDEKVLESIRLLSNFETPWAKLMQIVLAGQPQLAERLLSASMAQLRQRISFFIKIEPLTPEETDAYIDHRLRVAGYKGLQLFTVGARRQIAEHSKGTPRIINNICFAAMSLGWALKCKTINQGMITDVLADLSPAPVNEWAPVVPNLWDKYNQAISPMLPHREGTAPARLPVNERKTVTSQLEDGKKPVNLPTFRLIQKDSPLRHWLSKLAAGGTVLLALSLSVGYLGRATSRVPVPMVRLPAKTHLAPMSVFGGSQVAGAPELSSSAPSGETPSDESTSGAVRPSAIQSPVASGSSRDVGRVKNPSDDGLKALQTDRNN